MKSIPFTTLNPRSIDSLKLFSALSEFIYIHKDRLVFTEENIRGEAILDQHLTPYPIKIDSKSFRSTYIMYRLLAKQPIKAVAVNCGTSSIVIDSYYARFITIDMYDDSFTDLPE